MNKTVYLRDEDVLVWENARRVSGDKLSPVIMEALRKYVLAEESRPRGFARIEVRFRDVDDHNVPKAKAFHGRWLIFPESPHSESSEDADGPYSRMFAVALTAKDNVVVYSWNQDAPGYPHDGERFSVYPSFSNAASDLRVNRAVLKAMDAMGVPVEELDI